MKNNTVICSTDFYDNVGFNTIRAWLMKNCRCSLNEDYFHKLEPYSNKVEIEASQLLSDELLASFQRNSPILLETIPDITELFPILEISGTQMNSDHFQELYQILNCSSYIKSVLKKNDFPLWYSNSQNLISSTVAISAIEKIFDNTFEMKLNASSKLKHLSRATIAMEDQIKEAMVKLMNLARSKNWLRGEQIVWRNGRSMLPLKVGKKRKIKGIVQDQSATGQTAYVEPMEIIELNNHLSELQFERAEETTRILRKLTEFFHPMAGQIQESFYVLKHLDRHFTIAKLAHKLKSIRPELSDEGQMLLEKAANPLFTLAGKDLVALDIKLNNDKILLLSGPNAGGKTVVLKSLGLYAIMAQCGIYIPAKKAQLPLFTQFMADIGDRQSIENDLSTFSAHIQNITEIIQTADNNTLVLLDELGTGTDPDAGAALSRALLEALLKKKATVIATTHLSALKVWAFDAKGILNGGMIFDANALAPTFKLQLGTPGASYSLEIAKRMGLNSRIIQRSKVLLENGSIELENILSGLEKVRLETESLLSDLERQKQKLTETQRKINKKKTAVDKAHRMAKYSAVSDAEKIILETRKKAENLISDIRKNQANKKSIKKTKKQIENTLSVLQSEKKQTSSRYTGITKGDAVVDKAVFIPNLNIEGKIIHPPDKHNKVRILANGVTLSLRLSELQLSSYADKSSQQKNLVRVISAETLKNIQIDLRGKRADEAICETEKFLDTALLSGVEFVNILHGKGTGALMKVIHSYLKNQSIVSGFSFADEDQGGAGITVVQLK